MLKQSAYFVLSLVLMAAGILAMERTIAPSFQDCISSHSHPDNHDATEENPSGFEGVTGSYARCTGVFINANGSGITALATIVIAAFTATLWVATSRQARLTEEAFIADKRAFVFPDTFGQYWEPNAETGLYSWRFRPRLKNTGGTPTKRLRMHVECEVRNTALPQGYLFVSNEGEVGKGIIGPKGEMFGGAAPAIAVSPHDLAESQVGRRFIYLWGWIKYFDVFPGTKEHVTHFCWLITVNGKPMTFVPNTAGAPPTDGTLAFNYIQHTEGNYTDEDREKS